MRPRLANYTSTIFNPMVLSLVAILLMSLGTVDSVSGAIFMALLILTVGLLPVYLLALYLVKTGRMDSVFDNTRQQRRIIYVGGVISASITMLVVLLMDTPEEMVATLVTVLVAGVTFLIINNWWKISIHAAFAMGVAMLMIYLYGWGAAIVALPLVPLITWSRVELKQHTVGQVIAGVLVAAAIQPSVFYLFGLY